MQKMRVRLLGWEDPLEEGMATHSSILAWRIPWTEEPDGLYIVHRVAKSCPWIKWLCMLWVSTLIYYDLILIKSAKTISRKVHILRFWVDKNFEGHYSTHSSQLRDMSSSWAGQQDRAKTVILVFGLNSSAADTIQPSQLQALHVTPWCLQNPWKLRKRTMVKPFLLHLRGEKTNNN